MTSQLTLEQMLMAAAVLIGVLAILALYLFAQLVAARRKARFWDACGAPMVGGYTLQRRFGRVRLKAVRP